MTRSSRTIALLVFLVALFAGVFALLLAWEEYRAFEGEPLVEEETVRLQVRNGDTLRSVARRLETLGMTRVDWRWDLLSRRHDARIKAGEYQLDRGTTPVGMLRRLVAGDVLRHRFTIVEGWTVDELRATLAGDARLRRVTTDWDADRLMERLGCTGCFDEGRFLPETYFFVRGDRDLDLL
ncbi:MAG: endolytic transglycosylase MltG, partial [Wenzhouxiangellaceae bacterium]|nr:endolytic transglycosylase MltG [Wenzhouxiangellaceae bacterium]